MKPFQRLLAILFLLITGILIGFTIAPVISDKISGIVAATIAICGAIIVGYMTNFLAEDFRRFRDGSALASAIAGELSSHGQAVPLLRDMLNGLIECASSGKAIPIRPIDSPNDPVFDAGVSKLGLLEVGNVEDVVYVYQQIRAFRMSISIIFNHHTAMSADEIVNRCRHCLQVIENAVQRSEPLLNALKKRATEKYKPTIPWVV